MGVWPDVEALAGGELHGAVMIEQDEGADAGGIGQHAPDLEPGDALDDPRVGQWVGYG
jgi:hypothetical protein